MCDLWPVMLQVHSDPFSGCYILPTKKKRLYMLYIVVHCTPDATTQAWIEIWHEHPPPNWYPTTRHLPPPASELCRFFDSSPKLRFKSSICSCHHVASRHPVIPSRQASGRPVLEDVHSAPFLDVRLPGFVHGLLEVALIGFLLAENGSAMGRLMGGKKKKKKTSNNLKWIAKVLDWRLHLKIEIIVPSPYKSVFMARR